MFSISGSERTTAKAPITPVKPAGLVRANLKPHHVLKVRDTSLEGDPRRLDRTRVFAMALKYGLEGEELRRLAMTEAHRTPDVMEGVARSGFDGLLNYMVDVHANRSEDEIAAAFMVEARQGLVIRRLAKTALIKLGLAKDPVCDGCALAEHCLSTDGSRFDLSEDTIRDETAALDELEAIADIAEVEDVQRVWFRGFEELRFIDPDGYQRTYQAPYAITTAGMLLALVDSPNA